MEPLLSPTNAFGLPSDRPTDALLQPTLNFEAGSFKVGRSGQVEINYLADGGFYEGEVGVFSLRGMGSLVSDMGRFVREAVQRVLSRSTLGDIAISDRSEAAQMMVSLDGAQVNAGRYAGFKSFQFDPGDELAFLLVPNGTIADLQVEVQNGEISPDRVPLFSLATANPNDAFHLGQIADVTGRGNTFVWEDLRTDGQSDRDYNDLIFQVRGATTQAPTLDQVIDPNRDWSTTQPGIQLIEYLKLDPIGSITSPLPDPVTSAIHEAMDLQTYDPQVLSTVQHWVVGVLPGQSSIDLATLIGAKSLQPTGHIPNTYVWELPTGSDPTEVMARLKVLTGVEFAYPIVPLPLELQDDPAPTPPNPVFVNPANGNSYFLTNPTTWQDAQAVAEQFGGNLVAVNDAAENEWLVNTFGTRDLWIGLTDSEIYGATEGNFRWISGEPVTYTNWYPGNPNNFIHEPGGDGEDVVHMNHFGFAPNTPGLWNDMPIGYESVVKGIRRDPGIVEIANPSSWHLQMNQVTPVQNQVSGKGVTIGIVDSGLSYTHADLNSRYRADLSRSFRNPIGQVYGNDPSPDVSSPSFLDQQSAAHGTAVAGIAAGAANTLGGGGVAPGANVIGLRLLDSQTIEVGDRQVSSVTDLQIADGLSYLTQDVDIYNNSWNSLPFRSSAMSLYELHAGVSQGRDGLGNVYVFAAGNHQRAENSELVDENVNYDAFANSRYVIPVATLKPNGKQADYSESGAPLIVSAYADGVLTTDIPGANGINETDYASGFAGTSAAAPVVSGVVALMLEANPKLTWRDVQDILIRTATKNDPTDPDWQQNAAGLWTNHKYGFGAVNAAAAVALAKDANRVPLASEISLSSGTQQVNRAIPDAFKAKITVDQPIPDGGKLVSEISFSNRPGKVSDVQVKLSINHDQYQDLDVVLVSPFGTRVKLFSDVRNNTSSTILSTQAGIPIAFKAELPQSSDRQYLAEGDLEAFGGENPNGKWRLEVTDDTGNQRTGVLKNWELEVGTAALEQSVTIADEMTVEKVEVVFDAKHANRGDLKLVLVSPDGTEAVLSEEHDDGSDDYRNWVFSSARTWGESAKGDWTLRVADQNGNGLVGDWSSWKLNLFGAKPTVGIVASDPNAREGGDAGEFTVSRTGSTKFPLTVDYKLLPPDHWSRPLAEAGVDYVALPTQITIPAGAASVKVPVISKDDAEVEWSETIRPQLMIGNSYEVGSKDFAQVTIGDNEKPRIQVHAEYDPYFYQENYATESGNSGTFLFRRLGDLSQPTTVNYTMSGTAINGVDYKFLSGKVTLGVGEYDAPSLFLYPLQDKEIEGNEIALLTVDPSPNYNILVEPGQEPGRSWGSRRTTIWDDEVTPSVSFGQIKNGSEDGDLVEFEIVRSGNLSGDLTVNYHESSLWFKAKLGVDFEIPPGAKTRGDSSDPYIWDSVVIPDGQSSVKLQFKPIDDLIPEKRNGEEFIALTLHSDPNYLLGGVDQVSAYIIDNDVPQTDWTRQFGTPATDEAKAIAVDPDGNSYITGRTAGNLGGPNQGIYDAWIAKRDTNGKELWRKQLGTSGYDSASSITRSPSGNLYLTGWTDGSGSGRDTWIAKYDSNGKELWRKVLGEAATSYSGAYDLSNGGVAVHQNPDGSDSIYLTGYTYSTLNSTHPNQGTADAWVAQYNSNGEQKWVRQLGSTGWDEAHAVAVDATGTVYITGHTTGSLPGETNAGDSDAWVAKFTPGGDRVWLQQLGTVTEDVASSIAIDPAGKVYLAGHTKDRIGDPFLNANLNNGDFYEWGEQDSVWNAIHGNWSGMGGTYFGSADAWIAQIDPTTGNVTWKRQIGSTGYDSATSLTADSNGYLYLTGTTNGNFATTPAGGTDYWAATFNTNGALQWRKQFGSSATDTAAAIAVQGRNLYLAGSTTGNLEGTNAGGEDAFVMKISLEN